MEILKKSEGIVYNVFSILDVNFLCVLYNVFSVLDVNLFCVEILSEVFEQRQVVGTTLLIICNDEDIKLPAKMYKLIEVYKLIEGGTHIIIHYRMTASMQHT